MIYIITPCFLTVIVAAILGVIKIYLKNVSSFFDNILYFAMIFCIISLIPFKGSDIKHLWNYFFNKPTFKTIFNTLRLGYALTFSDINYDEFIKLEHVNDKVSKEILDEYMALHIKCAIILLLLSKHEIPKEINDTYMNYYEKGSDKYKILFAIYTRLLKKEIDFSVYELLDKSSKSITYEQFFLEVLMGREKDSGKLSEKLDEEIEKYEAIGIKDAYALEKKLYKAMSKEIIGHNNIKGKK